MARPVRCAEQRARVMVPQVTVVAQATASATGSRTAVYRWMVANAARFGFVNYPFEPWHWEWTGEAP